MAETKPGAKQPTAATSANVYDHATSAPTAAAKTKATDDVEAQKQKTAPVAVAARYDDEAGKGIGIAMFVCIIVGFAVGWIPAGWGPFISCIFYTAAIVLASEVTCGCCCGSNLKLNPKVKRWSTATLLCLVIMWGLAIFSFLIFFSDWSGYGKSHENGFVYAWWILHIPAAIFAGSSLGVENHVVMLKIVPQSIGRFGYDICALG